jgi:hypothetical protein
MSRKVKRVPLTHLLALRLCQKTVFLYLFVLALVAYKTSEYFSIHLVDIHRATVVAFGVSTRIKVNGYGGFRQRRPARQL